MRGLGLEGWILICAWGRRLQDGNGNGGWYITVWMSV